jgi:hypothetical protein
MTLKPRVNIETKPFDPQIIQRRDHAISARLASALRAESYRGIARQTGYNPETVRRYLSGTSKTPADFLGQINRVYDDIDLFMILDTPTPTSRVLAKHIPTPKLIDEFGHRIRLIEDSVLARVLVRTTAQDEEEPCP